MDRTEKLNTAYVILDLIQDCFEPPVPEASAPNIPIDQLIQTAKPMGLTALTAFALNKRGISDPSLKESLAKAQRQSVLYDAEYRKISNALSDAHIRHLPMKGLILKRLYPAVGLREMADMDILFDMPRAEDVKNIMTKLGYTTAYYDDSKHDVYTKPPFFYVEMHRQAVDDGVIPGCIEYYRDQWKKLIQNDQTGNYELRQRREDFYIYTIVHAYKHYLIAGTGVRALLDVYVTLRAWGGELDMTYIEHECQALGISDFEALIRRLSTNLFSRQNLSRQDADYLNDFICSGVHGNMDRYYLNAVKNQKSERSYVWSRLKMPENQLKHHPFLARHKALRPLYIPVRFANALFKRPKLLAIEFKTLHRYKKGSDEK